MGKGGKHVPMQCDDPRSNLSANSFRHIKPEPDDEPMNGHHVLNISDHISKTDRNEEQIIFDEYYVYYENLLLHSYSLEACEMANSVRFKWSHIK